ncbi:hypothetical protein MYCSP_19300 [Mycobacteroides saopaulense]|nr:hypothetical protein MYCSP_19300 [Mycobacteroides saopaulense]
MITLPAIGKPEEFPVLRIQRTAEPHLGSAQLFLVGTRIRIRHRVQPVVHQCMTTLVLDH